jgi:hypothetical protein
MSPLMQVDGNVPEGPTPLDHRRVVVRVRDGDGGQPAKALDGLDGRVVDQRDAIPEDVAAGGLNEQGPLADAELRLSADSGQVWLFRPDLVHVIGSQLVESRPLLTAPADVLTLVLADGTALGRGRALCVLGAAGRANELGHESPVRSGTSSR